jgi:hypothetical protein
MSKAKKMTPYTAALRDIIDGYTYRALYGKTVFEAATETGLRTSDLLIKMRQSPEYKARQAVMAKEDVS